MKKKIIHITLVIGMLIIWGFVAKKALFYFGKDNKKTASINPISYDSPMPEFKKDTFELSMLQRDPFLDAVIKRKSQTSNQKPVKIEKTSKPKQGKKSNINWPKLQYFGYLKGDSQSARLAVIKIDNKLHRLREKKAVEDIQVLKIYKDSVLLKKYGKTKMVIK
ncbi:hypothetical protein [Flagellimonas sp. CMM7]|uniref:hypothetical protein n=1 Tax=Flagellimonas sp. CMM7 TaxID=2654676 RepID=UPI0013D05B8F|nr:hypothetical protein [Flagellimonas sp. CMM7]UII80130.1 hypothetical protein LV704_01090 [Flagellimonas sp. CMM7]